MGDFHSEKRRTAELLKEIREKPSGEGNDGNPKLTWMYKGPEGHVDTEDYLLGRSVDKAFETFKLGAGADAASLDIPAPILPREKGAVPSVQVDLSRKLHEDPLLRIKMEEDGRRRALLNHPVFAKKIAAMKAAQIKAGGTSEKKRKKHKRKGSSDDSSDEEDLDAKLAAKLNCLRKKNESQESDLDSQLLSKLAALKEKDKKSKDASNPSVTEKKESKSKKSPSSSKRSRPRSNSPKRRGRSRSRSPRRNDRSRSRSPRRHHRSRSKSPRKPQHSYRDKLAKRKSRSRSTSRDKSKHGKASSRQSFKNVKDKTKAPPRGGVRSTKLTAEELERRRQEMMANADWRDKQRIQNVTRLNEEEKKEEDELRLQGGETEKPDFVRKQLVDAASSGTVADRIKSNMFKIQRSHKSMDSNFARR